MRKLTIFSVLLVVSALLVLPSLSAVADEGIPWFGLIPYFVTGGPPSGEPKAVFSADPTSGQVPLPVDFDASSSADPDGTIETYEWDFDDGDSDTGEQVTHTYDSAGDYTPELTVTDDDGKTDSYSDLTISVTSTNESPNASFTASPTSGTAPLDVTFDASESSDPDGSIDSYSWELGDGSTGTGETVTHTYSDSGSYTAQLTVEDDDGATDATTVDISVSSPSNEPPNASFSANPTSGETPLDVSFDASDSNDPDGSIESYSWDFNDRTTGSGVNVDHTFDNSGTYEVELTVTDNDGATDATTVDISVTSPSNETPNADFSANPTSGEAPLDVSFDASGSSDPDGSIGSYSWEFGDGSTGSGKSVDHTYDSSGTYNVELTVTDNDGATDSITVDISVSSPSNEPPNASFSANPTSGEAPLEVSFDASGSSDPDGSIASYDWDFNDGSTGSGETTSHTFDNSGDYTVELTVTDNDGASDTTTTQIEASSPVPTDIYVDVNNGSDQSGDGSQSNPYKTITKAVSMANDSSTHNNIYLESGVYTSDSGEDFPLTLDNIDLIGNPNDPNQVEVSGKLTIQNGELKGVHFYQRIVTEKNTLIKDNVFSGEDGVSVQLERDATEGSTITNNTFNDNNEGVTFSSWGGPVEITENEFNNSTYESIGGICYYSFELLISNNQFTGGHTAFDFSFDSNKVIIKNNDISMDYYGLDLSINSDGELLVEGNDISTWHNVVIEGETSAIIDLGGGPLGSSGNNIFQSTNSGDYYNVKNDLPAYSGTIYAKNNTWKDSTGSKIQPPDVLEGPADTDYFYIENKGNEIIFLE